MEPIRPSINLTKMNFGKPIRKIKEEHKYTIKRLANWDSLSGTTRTKITMEIQKALDEYKEQKKKL